MPSGGKVSMEPPSGGLSPEAKAMFNCFATIDALFPDHLVTVVVLINQENLSAFQALDQMYNNCWPSGAGRAGDR